MREAMKKLKAITKRVTSNNSSNNSSKGSNRRLSTRPQESNNQSIQVIRGGYNVDLNLVDESFTEVHKLCLLNRSEDSLFKLLESGVDVNVVDRVAGSAPLHLSVVGQNTAFILLLLSHGAQVDLKDGKGKTALMKAIEIENVEIAHYLLNNKANVNVPDDSGDTAIFLAIRNCFIDCIRLLIHPSINVNFNHLNNAHQLPLHLITNTNGLNEFLPIIIEKTVNVDIQDACKMTPLMLACTCGNEDAVNALLARKADVGIVDSQGRMAHEIARAHSFHKIATLIDTFIANSSKQNNDIAVRTNNQIKQAVLMNWTDSDDSSDDTIDNRPAASTRKMSSQPDTKPFDGRKFSGENVKRPSYGSVIDELNQLSQSKGNNSRQNSSNIQPSALRKTKVAISSRKSSQGSGSIDFNLKKLEASFLTSNSENNSLNSLASSDVEVPVKEKNVASAEKDTAAINDLFIQRLRDVLDDEIRDNDELDDLLMGGSSFNPPSQPVVENPIATQTNDQRRSTMADSPDTISQQSQESRNSSASLSPGKQSSPPRPLPTLAPIRSLISRPLDAPLSTPVSSKAFPSPSSSSTNVKSSGNVTHENHFDSDSSDDIPIVKSIQPKLIKGLPVNHTPSQPLTSSEKPPASTSIKPITVEQTESEIVSPVTLPQTITTTSIANESTVDDSPSTGRDSKLSTRETFDLNVRLKELQAAYESERVSRINLETELELLKKNSETFIHDFHTALREKIEFERKLYHVESEKSKLDYELQKVTGVQEDLIREINVLQEGKLERDKRILSLGIENERLMNEKASLEERINMLKDDLNKSESTNVDDENENDKRVHQVVLENINLINELSSLKEQHQLLKSDSIKIKSQLETELALRENEIKKLTTEKDILLKQNELLKVKYNEIHQVTRNSFTSEMGQLKDTIEQLTGKMTGSDNSVIDSKVQKALDETQGTLAELTRQIKLVKDATITMRDDQQMHDSTVDPIDDRLHKLQTSIGLLEDRIIAQEIRSTGQQQETNDNESRFIYPQLIQSLPVGRVPQSAFVRALLQSQDESHSKLIKEITAIKKDLGLFCWSVEQS